MYFIISTCEDGEPRISVMEKEELVENLTPDEDGVADLPIEDVHVTLPQRRTDLCAKAGTYIIKGELVIPKPKKVVKTFEVD